MATLLGAGISALVKSLRFEWHGDPLPERAVVIFWHSKMLAGWWLAKSDAVAMVSQSQDGQRLAHILLQWKYKLVRGSSSKEGREALENAIALVECRAASRIVITPDGPRGPRNIMKRGALIAAQRLGIPLVFLDISYQNAKVLAKSWDLFEVPYPLSKVRVSVHTVDISGFPEDREAQAAYLQHLSAGLPS